MKPSYLYFAFSFLVATIAVAQDDFHSPGNTSTADYIDVPRSTVQLIEDVDLPALESGQLTQIVVKPGDHVKKGQKVAQMDDTRSKRALDEATLRHQIANDRATDSTEVNTAYKRAELARAEYAKMNKLRRTGSMSEQQAERAKVSAEIAYLEYIGAKNAKKMAGVEAAAEMITVQASQDSISRHALTSPTNGTVYEVNRDNGEWLTAGETVLKIARMDRLRIPGWVEGDSYDVHEVANRQVTAKLTLARGQEVEFTGKIVFVDPIRRAQNRYVIWAEVDNRTHPNSDRWVLQPGSEVTMRIHLDKPVVQSASTGSINNSDELQK